MTKQLVKVRFALDPQDWHGHGGEFLWASPAGDLAKDEFEIRNYPCFARGISFEDVVKAAPSGDGRTFEFERVVRRSGHSTYMLLVEPDSPEFRTNWKLLEERGCSYEAAPVDLGIGWRDLYSVDVPPSADIHDVHRILEEGEAVGAWEFQDGYVHLPDE